MTDIAPTLDSLRRAADTFAGYAAVDRSWNAMIEATAPAIDLSVPVHRAALVRLLNAWGCRIRYPRDGEPNTLDEALAGWWTGAYPRLPAPTTGLADLSDREIDALAACYADLMSLPVTHTPRRRTLGATAAAKALHAIRPSAVLLWDEAIAVRLHGSRDAAAFGGHLRLGRAWARALLTEAGTGEPELLLRLGRPAKSLAKLLDEYCYLHITAARTT